MLLLPITTQFLPHTSTPVSAISSITPAGVHGRKLKSPIMIWPTFSGWKASTSFSGRIAFIIAFSFICFGSGSCTNIPFTLSSLLSFSTSSKSSASVVSSGRAYSYELNPTSAQAFFLLFTYTREAGLSPTITTAKPISMPFSLSVSASLRTCSFTLAETALPSIIRAI